MTKKTKQELLDDYNKLGNDIKYLTECYDYALESLSWFICEFTDESTDKQREIIMHRISRMRDLIIKRISNVQVNK